MLKYLVKGNKKPKFLYHWSPSSRRKKILKDGLKVSQKVSGENRGLGEWRPPYICFSNSPARAYSMLIHIPKGTPIDLYEVWPSNDHKIYRIPMPKGCTPEWRIQTDIPRHRFRLVATFFKD